MKDKNERLMITDTPELQWDASGLPIYQKFDDVYFSKENGL